MPTLRFSALKPAKMYIWAMWGQQKQKVAQHYHDPHLDWCCDQIINHLHIEQ